MFQFDDTWDVDRTAESLNISLFGKSKKHKALTSASANNGSQFNSRVVPDSDDEQYSKNDKKRLKKWRKKNKPHGKQTENDSTRLQINNNAVTCIAGLPKKNIKANDNCLELSERKLEFKTPLIKSSTSVANLKNKKMKQKIKKDSTNTPSSEKQVEKKSRKRKFSPDDTDKNILGNVSKKAKAEENKSNTVSTNDVTASGEEKKKRRRNRKKKNNSKKNKYKHLALNKTGDLDISQGNESIDSKTQKQNENEKSSNQTLKPSSTKLNNHKERIQNSKDTSSKKTVTNNTGILKLDTNVESEGTNREKKDTKKKRKDTNRKSKDTNMESNSNSADVHSLGGNKSKKRKGNSKHLSNDIDNSNNSQPPIKKLKKNKDNSNNGTLGNSPQSQPTRVAAEFEKLSPTTPKVSVKNKRKQQILLKMLSANEVNKQDNAGENIKNDLVLNKKKGNMHAVNRVQNGADIDSLELSHSSHLTPENKLKINQGKGQQQVNINKKSKSNTASPASKSIWGKAAELGQQAQEKLNSARFRYINEQLYSCKGNEALQLFREDQDAFSVYHDGFQNQASKWPLNPLDVFIKQLKDKPKNIVIADFGCGEAKLAHNIPQKVHSFDLVALNDTVTACDMSKTPLAGEQVDIAVFCLSLMGTNISDYIHEASRVLKTGGLLKVAEVVSRFSGLSRFTDAVCSYGFQLLNRRDLNQMFYMLDFKKMKFIKKSTSLPEIKLKPCIYKRR